MVSDHLRHSSLDPTPPHTPRPPTPPPPPPPAPPLTRPRTRKLNTDDFLECPNTVLSDVDARGYIGGVALQWAGKGMGQRVQQSFGDALPLIQSENECGDGTNTWDYAMYIFDLMRHYLGESVDLWAGGRDRG